MNRERSYWVWVTRPEYYYDEDGSPRDILDPSVNPGGDSGWWTCHKETMAGDLVLLYRSAPESDIAYVLEATSNARLLGRNAGDGVVSWTRFAELVREADKVDPSWYAESDIYDSFAAEYEDVLRLRTEAARRWERLSEDPTNSDLLEAFDEVDPQYRLTSLRSGVFFVLDLDDVPLEDELGFGVGSYVCDWRPRYVFESPLELADLKADAWLAKNWNALRANFIQRAYRTAPEVWSYLVSKAEQSGNGTVKAALRALGDTGPSADVVTERDLEDTLTATPALVPGYDLKLVGDGYAGTGRQIGIGIGFIDILGIDRSTGNYVVVELKAVRATRAAVGQTMSYVGWVSEHLAGGKPVEALVISNGVDAKFASAASAIPNLRQVDISELDI